MKKNIYFCAVLAASLSGCLPSADPRIAMKPPVYVEQLPAKQVNNQPNAGSLFGRGDNPLFADRKAMNVNDIVTVVISERANQSSSGKHDTSKNSTINLGGGLFSAGSAPLSTLATQLNKVGNIGFSAGTKNEFTGAGSSVRAEAFTTTISATHKRRKADHAA